MTVQRPTPITTHLERHVEAAFNHLSLKEGGGGGKLPVSSVKSWFREAGLSGMAITGEYTGLSDSEIEAAVSECAKDKEAIKFDEFMKFLSIICQKKQKQFKGILQKLVGSVPLAVVESGV